MRCVHPLSAPQHVAALGPGGRGHIQDRQRTLAAPRDAADLWDPVGCPWSLCWLPAGCVISAEGLQLYTALYLRFMA